MLDTDLTSLHTLKHVFLKITYKAVIVITSTLQVKITGHGEVERQAQGHRASKQQSQHLHPAI